jgi:hypothetical protein
MSLSALLLLAAASHHAHHGVCDAKPIQNLVGRPANKRNKALAKVRSHASIVREVPADGVMTMDYSPNRLNIITGKDGRIARLNCG